MINVTIANVSASLLGATIITRLLDLGDLAPMTYFPIFLKADRVMTSWSLTRLCSSFPKVFLFALQDATRNMEDGKKDPITC